MVEFWGSLHLELTNDIPGIRFGYQSSTELILHLRLKSEESDSATVRNIVYWSNLQLTSANLEGTTIARRGTYTLTFKRINTEKHMYG